MMRISIPSNLTRLLQALRKKLRVDIYSNNLRGDRDIEWSWIVAQLQPGTGTVLDFGCGKSSLSLIAARLGYHVTAIDLEPIQFPYHHDRLKFIQGDLLECKLPKNHFDIIINCSTVEHVGLVGRFGVKKQELDGDLKAMSMLWHLMTKQGIMLLTIPIGQDAIFKPMHRVYGNTRLPILLKSYSIEKEEYWMKKNGRIWIKGNKREALDRKPSKTDYSLGLFLLKKSTPPA